MGERRRNWIGLLSRRRKRKKKLREGRLKKRRRLKLVYELSLYF